MHFMLNLFSIEFVSIKLLLYIIINQKIVKLKIYTIDIIKECVGLTFLNLINYMIQISYNCLGRLCWIFNFACEI